MKKTKIAAIDIGTSKICAIMADTNGTGELRILGIGTAASRGLEKGVIVNTRDATAAISQSVRKAERMAGYRLKSAYAGVSGEGMSSLNNRGVISIPHDDQLVHAADRKRALEVARSVDVPDEQRLLHVIPRSFNIDGQGNIKDPVGMYGFRLHVETHIVTVPVSSARDLIKCIMSLGISVDGLVLKSLASAEAVLTKDERQNGVMLVDIGSGTTDVAIFKDGSVCHTATLPVGGDNITNDVALGLGLTLDLAEDIKTKYGNLAPSEKDSDDVTVTESGHGVSYHDLHEIISARVEELIQLILIQVEETGYTKAIPSGLVLTGGSCNLPGIAELSCKVTKMPVRIGAPVNTDSGLCDPAYATSVGLIYWKMKNKGLQDWQTKRWSPHVLAPRFLGYFNSKNALLNSRSKEMKDGKSKLRTQPS